MESKKVRKEKPKEENTIASKKQVTFNPEVAEQAITSETANKDATEIAASTESFIYGFFTEVDIENIVYANIPLLQKETIERVKKSFDEIAKTKEVWLNKKRAEIEATLQPKLEQILPDFQIKLCRFCRSQLKSFFLETCPCVHSCCSVCALERSKIKHGNLVFICQESGCKKEWILKKFVIE